MKFRGRFCPFFGLETSLPGQKTKIFKKRKKKPLDSHRRKKCTKFHPNLTILWVSRESKRFMYTSTTSIIPYVTKGASTFFQHFWKKLSFPTEVGVKEPKKTRFVMRSKNFHFLMSYSPLLLKCFFLRLVYKGFSSYSIEVIYYSE